MPGRRPLQEPSTERARQRAEQFLEAATREFLEKGYRSTRLADIVARSGGSLSTLYDAFGDKQGLALAIMERSIRSFGEGLAILDQPGLSPLQALPAAAERLAAEMLSPERTVSHRIVIGEGLAFPEMRDWFFEHSVAPAHARLAEYFARQVHLGTLAIADPVIAADQFYMALFGGAIIRSVNGITSADELERLRADARAAALVFLHGVLPR